MIDTDLLVVGAGAKGTAIAMKAQRAQQPRRWPRADDASSRRRGRRPRGWTVTASPPAARCSRSAPPRTSASPTRARAPSASSGRAIDAAALSFSWQRYLVEKGDFAALDRRRLPACPAPRLRRLPDVGARARERRRRARARARRARVAERRAGPLDRRRRRRGRRMRYSAGAFVLTGPGVHRTIAPRPRRRGARARLRQRAPGDRARAASRRAPTSRSSAAARARSAAWSSCARSDPTHRLTVYTPGLPMSRVESFVENRIFSNPEEIDWPSLSVQTRRDFIARRDRGVFGPERIAAFAYDERCRFVPGRVVHVASARAGAGVSRRTRGRARRASCNEHDYVINCTGFDLLEQLRVLLRRGHARGARAPRRARVGPPARDGARVRALPRARWRCSRGCSCRGWPRSARDRASPTSARWVSSPTVCWPPSDHDRARFAGGERDRATRRALAAPEGRSPAPARPRAAPSAAPRFISTCANCAATQRRTPLPNGIHV